MPQPILSVTIPASYWHLDKFKNHSFSITEETYNALFKKLEFKGNMKYGKYYYCINRFEDKHKPGVFYHNLKIRPEAAPKKLSKEKKGCHVELDLSVYHFDWMGKEGVRGILEDYRLADDELVFTKQKCVPLSDIMD